MVRTGHRVPLRAPFYSASAAGRSHRHSPAQSARLTSAFSIPSYLLLPGRPSPLRTALGDAMVVLAAAVTGPVFRVGDERAMLLRGSVGKSRITVPSGRAERGAADRLHAVTARFLAVEAPRQKLIVHNDQRGR